MCGLHFPSEGMQDLEDGFLFQVTYEFCWRHRWFVFGQKPRSSQSSHALEGNGIDLCWGNLHIETISHVVRNHGCWLQVLRSLPKACPFHVQGLVSEWVFRSLYRHSSNLEWPLVSAIVAPGG